MRQRRVTGIDERISVYGDLILCAEGSVAVPSFIPDGRYPRWYERGSGRYVLPEGFCRAYAEFGCGRGQFINTLAQSDPDSLYIGIEGCKTILIGACKKTCEEGLNNTRFIDLFINDPAEAFGRESLDGVFLNFSDPWPKIRHANRRLTAPGHAEGYLQILKTGGFAAVKTDGEAFFDYSLDIFQKTGFRIAELSRNLPETDVIQTEYEQKFRALGKPIFYFKALKESF